MGNLSALSIPFKCVNKLYVILNSYPWFIWLEQGESCCFPIMLLFHCTNTTGGEMKNINKCFKHYSLGKHAWYRTSGLYVSKSLYVCVRHIIFFLISSLLNFSLAEPRYVFWRWNLEMHFRIGLQIHLSTNFVSYEHKPYHYKWKC